MMIPERPTLERRVLAALDGSATSPEAHEARLRALELAPDNPALLNDLAWEEVGSGQARKAIAIAEKAVRLAPTNPDVVDTYAAALDALGLCSAAIRLQMRALDLLAEDTTPERAAAFRRRLLFYESRCRDGGPAAAR